MPNYDDIHDPNQQNESAGDSAGDYVPENYGDESPEQAGANYAAEDEVPEPGETADSTPTTEQEDAEGVLEHAAEADAALEYAGEEGPVDSRQWFIIHTYSGFERKVAESLRTRSEAFGFSDKIGQILIPEEEVVELRNGKKVTSKRLLYPGYVVVQMEMNDELWHRVKDTPRVTGFVGGGQTPVPLTADEINKMLYRQTTSAERPRPKMTFEKNETVRIIDGPFANFSGKVDEINTERSTLRVLVTIFGRATPVELDFLQVEKSS